MNIMIEKGDVVSWEWGKVVASGTVIDTYSPFRENDLDLLAMSIEISHTATLLIEMKDGRKIIKMEDEVKPLIN